VAVVDRTLHEDGTHGAPLQSDLRLHFGLAAHRRADKLEIFWPSGARETLTGLDADHAYCIGEGAGVVPCGAIRPTRILVR